MKPKPPKDINIGTVHESNKFGLFEVVNYSGYARVYVQFISTGFIKKTTVQNIRRGAVRDPFFPSVFGVGFVGVGRYVTTKNKKTKKSYQVWHAMFERCYSRRYREIFPSYEGCSVRSDWNNYQSFAMWFDENYPGNEYDLNRIELDKDIKIDGNKEYSKDACMFVSRRENTIKARAKNYSFISPTGERVDLYNLSEFCRDRGLTRKCMCGVNSGERSTHKGWTKA